MKDNKATLSDLSVASYEALEDKADIDVVLEFIEPSARLKMADGIERLPLQDSMSDFTFKEVIFFKNSLREGNIDSVFKKMYDVDNVSDLSVYSVTAVYKFINSEMERILKNEERLSSKKDSDTWKAAGIEKLNGFGEYANVFMLAGGLIYEDQILAMKYYRVFDYQEISKDWNEIQDKFQKLKQK
jgi:hypothetical protein